ncbi:MAG: Ada metal-binding domain-containing protein [Atribacterota bacterium]|jgi:hypothetical protein|nr:Ada metal-binding domain-containing protein [Atribacterota bacterium]
MKRFIIIFLLLSFIFFDPSFHQTAASKTFFAIIDSEENIIAVLDVFCISCEMIEDGCSIVYLFGDKPVRYQQTQLQSSGKQPLLNINNKTTSSDIKEEIEKEDNINASDVKYIGSKQSNIFHIPSCRHAERIEDYNIIYFSTRSEAINSGYKECKVCSP